MTRYSNSRWDKARRFAKLDLPPLPRDAEAILLLPADTGSHHRRNIYRWLVERYAKRFPSIYDIPGSHNVYGDTSWEICKSSVELSNYQFGATLCDRRLAAATLWADLFQRDNPLVEEA